MLIGLGGVYSSNLFSDYPPNPSNNAWSYGQACPSVQGEAERAIQAAENTYQRHDLLIEYRHNILQAQLASIARKMENARSEQELNCWAHAHYYIWSLLEQIKKIAPGI